MKTINLLVGMFVCTAGIHAQWKPAGDKIKTQWAEQINPDKVLPEYPRPLIERNEWLNLNGLWEYAIVPRGHVEPAAFDGKILVPFAVESSLSGVQKGVGESEELWYKRDFTVPTHWKNRQVILNFGAVDWKADVFVNDILIGSHQGGYTPFSFNITPFLSGKTKDKLAVRVWDPSDKGYQPRGKQVTNPQGIWYTSVTGIWQTVWLEPVAENHITAVKPVSDIDNNVLAVTVFASGQNNNVIEVKLLDKGQVIATAKGIQGKELRLSVENPSLWSPDNPYLYYLQISLIAGGKTVDEVKSYTAFRKISVKRDANGLMRMQLNNKNLFHYGPLDQGWWPDGLYTAPTDEALVFDIKKTKQWGFNMIRKHVKVEPARWYYHCDREGVMVWQDMPSGDHGRYLYDQCKYNGGMDAKRSQVSIANYYREWKEIMDLCDSHPSVVVWVPFNEAWGQFDTEKVAEWTVEQDPSRLVNPASGGNHRPCGHIMDLHNYPAPDMCLFDPVRVNVLGEYGGIGLPLEEHLWWQKRNWGYIQFKSSDEVTTEYVKYAQQLKDLVKRGFSAAVYTQTTDVEGEVNGLMTYDRKAVKINEADVRKANQAVISEGTD
ncbi:MAG: beta-galactosidase [Bacteroidales bacterium]|jgi:beta-galactosidase/beta-glucuronidase|nr:beta-galactosidase [Bacteroidales bacterium]